MYTPVVYDTIAIRSVRLSRRAEKDLEGVPGHIVLKLLVYVERITKHEY